MSLAAGTRLGPYQILAALGVGGMGEVYRARDTKLGRDVALKVIPDTFALDPDRLARFTREALQRARTQGKRLGRPNVRVPIERLQRVSGLSADVAAERLGVSRSTVKRWRRGILRQFESRANSEG